MSASRSGLHPLAQRIAPGEIQFTLRDAGVSGERIGVTLSYRPYRERDVTKQRRFHLFGWWGRNHSQDRITVQREESHEVRQVVIATGSTIAFAAPLRDQDAHHEPYQLASVRVVGQRIGTVEFQRWFADAPVLDPGFGFVGTTDSLRGTLRPSGLGARPLSGSLPLWPALRVVDLQFAPVSCPTLRLWDSAAKHHWDGWRSATPQGWPGGRSIVTRHIAGPTVWRDHETFAFLPADSPEVARIAPPPDTLPGVALDVFWPDGEVLEFPEVRFDAPVDCIALAVARLSPRVRELLARSVTLRPGLEMGSLAASEWAELSALAADTSEVPVAMEMVDAPDGRTVLRLRRRGLAEPWLLLFGAGYEEDRRCVLTSLLLDPSRWNGPVPAP